MRNTAPLNANFSGKSNRAETKPNKTTQLINRGGVFMSTVLFRLTLQLTKIKETSVLISWFSGTSFTGTQQNR